MIVCPNCQKSLSLTFVPTEEPEFEPNNIGKLYLDCEVCDTPHAQFVLKMNFELIQTDGPSFFRTFIKID